MNLKDGQCVIQPHAAQELDKFPDKEPQKLKIHKSLELSTT